MHSQKKQEKPHIAKQHKMYSRISTGYGMTSSLSNSSPISYGAMQPKQSYGSASGYSCGGGSANIASYLGPGQPTNPASYKNFCPSMLEVALEDVKPTKAAKYSSSKAYEGLYLNNKASYFPTDAFLSTERPDVLFVEQESDILPHVEEAFEKLVGSKFPKGNIKVHILDDKKFEKAHKATGGTPSPGIRGFALNRQGKGVSEVFVRKDHLDRMMLTLGHEIGHVMSPTLSDARDEEAKAFAFSIAWMKTIKEHNIAGIGNYIIPEPAKNGLHDVALEYLFELIQKGKSAMQLFKELARGLISITKRIEVIYR